MSGNTGNNRENGNSKCLLRSILNFKLSNRYDTILIYIMLDDIGYQLELIIKEVCLDPVIPGVVFVETSFDGRLMGKSEQVKLQKGKALCDFTLIHHFVDIEPPIPIVVSLTVYKRKLLQTGFYIVGCLHFAVVDLIPILNKTPIVRRLSLHLTKKQFITTGNILLQVRLNYHNLLPSELWSTNKVMLVTEESALNSPVPVVRDAYTTDRGTWRYRKCAKMILTVLFLILFIILLCELL